jgi:UPF0716 protein FxsA
VGHPGAAGDGAPRASWQAGLTVRRFGLLVVAALVTLVAEVLAFAAVARWVGVVWALLAILATSVLGGWLVRREGVRSWRRFRAALAARRAPGREASDGLVGLVGALLLAAPGFVTDLIGALLLVPPLRWAARDRLERAAERRISPLLAGDLFGPRRVRVRRRRTRRPPAAGEPRPGGAPDVGTPAGVIEGAVVSPDVIEASAGPGPADGPTGRVERDQAGPA